jgi:hypothetical protein
MSDDDTMIMEPETVTVQYRALDDAAQKEMIRNSLLNLERLHLECRINMSINDPDVEMVFEEGGHPQKLGDRMEMLDDKLRRFKIAFKDLL